MPYKDREKDLARRSAYNKRNYQARRKWLDDIKVSEGCAHCGETDPIVLEWHHLDPAIKTTNINQLMRSFHPIAEFQAELAKCIVLCANCHKREEAKRHPAIMPDYSYKVGGRWPKTA